MFQRDILLAFNTNKNEIIKEDGVEIIDRNLPREIRVTIEEAKWAATPYKDNTPGVDLISTRLLPAMRPAIENSVRKLYEGSLRHSYFTTLF